MRRTEWVIEMDIIDMARASGLAVILDGRIGREEYQSVCGSVSALQRFAEAILECAENQHDCAAIITGQPVRTVTPELHQPREEHVEDHHRLARAGGGRSVERAPVHVVPRMLAAAAGNKGCGRLRTGEEMLVAQAVLVGQ